MRKTSLPMEHNNMFPVEDLLLTSAPNAGYVVGDRIYGDEIETIVEGQKMTEPYSDELKCLIQGRIPEGETGEVIREVIRKRHLDIYDTLPDTPEGIAEMESRHAKKIAKRYMTQEQILVEGLGYVERYFYKRTIRKNGIPIVMTYATYFGDHPRGNLASTIARMSTYKDVARRYRVKDIIGTEIVNIGFTKGVNYNIEYCHSPEPIETSFEFFVSNGFVLKDRDIWKLPGAPKLGNIKNAVIIATGLPEYYDSKIDETKKSLDLVGLICSMFKRFTDEKTVMRRLGMKRVDDKPEDGSYDGWLEPPNLGGGNGGPGRPNDFNHAVWTGESERAKEFYLNSIGA